MATADGMNPLPEAGVTARFARLVAGSRREDLPPAVLHEAKRTLLNHLAAGFGGCREPAVDTLLAVLGPLSGPPSASIIGRSERLDVLNAAFMNAVIANVLDFCDTHLRTVIHPAAPIVPPLLAYAQSRSVLCRAGAGQPIAGADVLHAIVLGTEIACRVGNAMSPAHYARGWHITSTCGGLGAAAAMARLLGLDEQRTIWALGHAAAQASGLVETLGFDAKSLSVGNAARAGLLAALLAERGFAGPPAPIEGQRGFLAVMSDRPDSAALGDRLGEIWEIAHNTYKPYPCGVVLHPVIDACLALRSRPSLVAASIGTEANGQDAVARIVVRGHPLLRQRTDRPRVSTGREAQVCVRHTVAVSLIDGAAGIAQYTDARVADPNVRALGAKVAIEDDASLSVEAAIVTVQLASGAVETLHVAHARGSLAQPLSDLEIETKLRDLARLNAPNVDAGRLIDAVWTLDRAPDAGLLLPLAGHGG